MLPLVPRRHGGSGGSISRSHACNPTIRRAASTGSIRCPASTAAARRCANPAASCWRLDNGLHGFDPANGKLSFLVHPEPDEPGNRYNDGRCDRRGRLWIGTMDIGIRRASGSFYRIGADRSALRLFDGITVPNSTAFSPDDRTLYFADTPRHVIWAFDFNLHAGMIGERRVFADLTDAARSSRRLLRRRRRLPLECRIRRPSSDPLRARRPRRPHHRTAGDQSDLLLLRRRAVSTRSMSPARGAQGQSARPLDGALLALDVGVRGLPEAAFAAKLKRQGTIHDGHDQDRTGIAHDLLRAGLGRGTERLFPR